MNLDRYRGLRRVVDDTWINIHPIQRGGVLPPESREALISFGDGYSTCDLCIEGRVDLVKTPPILDFAGDVAKFLNMDEVRFTPGARGAKQAVFKSIAESGDTIVIDSLAHYTTYIAAEVNGLKIVEVPHGGYPEFRIKTEDYVAKIEEVRRKTGELPAAVLLTHVDYRYGNLADAADVGKIAGEYGVPYVLNAAYSAGVMPVDGKKLGVDFLICSGHKSWGASGPVGILATTYEFSGKTFRTSAIKGPWSGRAFLKKDVYLFGCPPVFGAPVATLMASFPHVVERVKHWDEEVEKIRWLVNELERIKDFHQLGERPRQHTLVTFETPSFHKVAKKHSRKGFFLYEELKKKKIAGVHAGMTKMIKLNSYGLTKEQLQKVADAFQDIARAYEVEVE
ncbi:MAG TPA: O-phospho-L-seryl-tRNA:Cys-tRNA synthase [Hadesarchaea archaeon]|nr:O-phospho-L-seryl-tRNA:Cys-tRNA synthase [Hadesarchaea archaeon]